MTSLIGNFAEYIPFVSILQFIADIQVYWYLVHEKTKEKKQHPKLSIH